MQSTQTLDSDTLKDLFLTILQQLYQLEESVPFRSLSNTSSQVTDLSATPMDLFDIECRLNANMYLDPWKFINDVWNLFESTWYYNRDTSKLYQCCTKLAKSFETEMNKVMKSIGFCCGRQYLFTPSFLECFAKKCPIGKNAKYYDYKNEYIICSKCYLNNQDEFLKTKTGLITRNHFVEKKNDKIIPEEFVECKKCRRKLHKICVLYVEQIEKEEFVCNSCDTNSDVNRSKKFQNFSAKKLLSTELSNWLQSRLNNFFKTKNIEHESISVRVVFSSRKIAFVKSEMKRRFSGLGKFPDGFPYTAKTIFVFQEFDAVDVSLFCMYVQEYDSSCSGPNNRRVYISYLDSVNFFRPKEMRTDFYYEIVLGYIDYVKMLGYKTVHVWACPPPDGDDYLFYRHPPNQKSPDHERLEQWYTKLLNKGIAEGIILKNLNVLPVSNIPSVIYELPYFDNDLWPNVLEDSLKKLDEIGNEDKNMITNEMDDTSIVEKFLMKQLHSIHDELKEVFFIFQLHSTEELTNLLPIIDPDPLIECELMKNRDTFLMMSRDNNYEFSSIRRAKFSSLILLYELHTNNYGKSITYICNSCSNNLISGYHCISCEDFDLCLNCWNKEGHEHDMEFIAKNNVKAPAPEHELNIIIDAETLLHSRLCKDKNCNISGCARIKRSISHFTVCPTKLKMNCPVCKHLLTMCWHHAKFCQTKNCSVPTCERVKMKLAR